MNLEDLDHYFRPLFLIGNKRSGTSHLVRLLNLHPRVFVSHESDIVWLLYQIVQGRPLQCYPWDGPGGLLSTLKACSSILGADPRATVENLGVREAFFRVQEHLMKAGSDIQVPYDKQDVLWKGDKKPVQQADPALRGFLKKNFPDARYIHLVRDPRAVALSASAYRGGGKVGYWNSSHEQIMSCWALHEQWVQQVKRDDESSVFSLRFEDLCDHPAENLERVFAFLGLDTTTEIREAAESGTEQGANDKYNLAEIEIPEQVRPIAESYGYGC